MRGVLTSVGVVALVCAAVATAADRPLAFTVVKRGSSADSTPAAMRRAYATIVEGINGDPIDEPDRPTAVDYRRFVGVYVLVYRPTAGYRLAITRLTLQRRGSLAQLCALVRITKPTGAVAQVLSHVYDFVKVRRTAFGANIPAGIVVRESSGTLVYHTTVGTRTKPALCHA